MPANPVVNKILHFATHPGMLTKNIKYRLASTISSRKHIFVVGVPRSGTTLLKTVLATHPDIAGSDWESTGIFGFRDIFQYRMGELRSEEIAIFLNESKDIIEFYDRVVDALLERTGKRYFVDKLQVKGYRLRYAQKHFPESLFVNIVRDGRDCYCSALKHPHVRQSASLQKFARYWAQSNQVIASSIPPQRLYSIRYEDLTTNSAAATREIMSFMGLEFFAEQVDVDHYGATNTMKKREVHQNLARPISARSQKRWERELTRTEQEIFWSIAGESLQKYGYKQYPES